MSLSTRHAGMPDFSKSEPVKGGGSTITPLPSIHMMNPEVDS